MKQQRRCPKCHHFEKVRKHGFQRWNRKKKRRYFCRNCNYHFTWNGVKGAPAHLKKMALELYLEGLSAREIARKLFVSNVAVSNWIRKYGRDLKEIRQKKAEMSYLWVDQDNRSYEMKASDAKKKMAKDPGSLYISNLGKTHKIYWLLGTGGLKTGSVFMKRQ